MSRLDSFIRRMTAQRDILNLVSTCLDDIPGTILEFGLGSGRTFDHLRERFPGRQLIAFENDPCDQVVSRLAPLNLVVGDLRETTRNLQDGSAALVQVDLAGGTESLDNEIRGWLTPLTVRLLAPGGYLASDFALSDPRLVSQPLPSSVAPGRYHLSRRAT